MEIKKFFSLICYTLTIIIIYLILFFMIDSWEIDNNIKLIAPFIFTAIILWFFKKMILRRINERALFHFINTLILGLIFILNAHMNKEMNTKVIPLIMYLSLTFSFLYGVFPIELKEFGNILSQNKGKNIMNQELIIAAIIFIGFIVQFMFSIYKFCNPKDDYFTMFSGIRYTMNDVFTTFILFYSFIDKIKYIMTQKDKNKTYKVEITQIKNY